jgi:hypothetical protein
LSFTNSFRSHSDQGVTLVGGIADYDKERRFGLPRSDVEVAETEAVELGNPAYAGSLYNPDGIIREKYRRDRGVQLIRENPVWFAGVMARRAFSMLEPERVPPVAPSVDFDEHSPTWARFVGQIMWWPQKLIYSPAIILALIVIGLVIAVFGSTDRRWTLLLAVPAYALLVPIDATHGAALYGCDLVLSSDLLRSRRGQHREMVLETHIGTVQNGVKLLLTGLASSLKL